jgi:hypothetical protein
MKESRPAEFSSRRHLDNLSDVVNKNFFEAEDGLPFLIRNEKNEILVEALLSPKVAEVLKKFEGQSITSSK